MPKTRYRGLAKNKQRLALLLGFANLLIAEPQLAEPGRSPSDSPNEAGADYREHRLTRPALTA